MLKDFRDFVLRGNVVALAIAVVVGVAFGAVVTSFVEDLVTPLIAAIGGQPDFSDLTFTINGSVFRYGQFINAVISFVIIAAVVFFLVIRPMNKLMARFEEEEPDTPPEYDTATASGPAALAEELTRRGADGWTVVSVTESADGSGLTAVLLKE